jgi:DNA-binding IclR family transcriptional regulator
MKDNRSVLRILSILELISQHEEGLTLGQIYRELKMPKATTYDFLQTLYKADAIYYKDPRLKNYVIGSKMFAIGSVYTKNSSLIESSEFDLKTIANRYGKTAFICKETAGKIVYVYKFQPSSSLIATPEEIGSIVIDTENHPIAKTFEIFSKKEHNEDERTVIKRGYYSSDYSTSGHISTICVPIRNFENKICGVLALCDLHNPEANEDDCIAEFIYIAKVTSKKLGNIEEHIYE